MADSPTQLLLEHIKRDPARIFTDAGHKEIVVARAPGRLDVMGGVAHHAGGLVCQYPLEIATAIALQRRDDRKLVIKTYNADASTHPALDNTVTLSLDDFYGTAALLPNRALHNLFLKGRDWAAYVAGAFPALAKHKKITRRTHGANIACFSTIPLRAGLASSAAIACATLWAMTAAYHLILDPLEIALLAQRIENQTAAVPSGVMDPVTSMVGRANQLLVLNCQPHELQGYIPLPKGILLAGIFTGQSPPSDAAYRAATASAFIAQAAVTRFYRDLGFKKDPTGGYLANVPADIYAKYLRLILPEMMTGEQFIQEFGIASDRATAVDPRGTYFPRAAAEHHIYENTRVHAFASHLRELEKPHSPNDVIAQAVAAGKLMLASHESYSRNLRLGNPNADLLVNLLMERGAGRGFYGARLTAEGAGGTVALLAADTDEARSELQNILADYQRQTGLSGQLFTGSSAGACDSAPQRLPSSEFRV